MEEYKVYLPIHDNDKRPIPITAFEEWERLCLSTCGGFTKGSDVEGYWQSNKLVYVDHNRVYYVCGELQAIKDNLVKVNSYFKQISYFVSLISSNVQFVEMEKNNG